MRTCLVAILSAVVAAGCGGPGEADREAAKAKAVELSAGITALQIVDVKPGDGATASPGRRVSVHYTGTLLEGTKFDSSRDRGQPFEFQLGAGEVIAGWDEGIKGMKVGGVRQLTIPAAMAYGSRGAGGDIPPNAALKFEVELVAVK